MAEERAPFPNPNPIRLYAQAELIRRRINSDFSDIAIPSPIIMPFVRFTSTKVDAGSPKPYQFFHLGLHGFPLKEDVQGLTEKDVGPTGLSVFEMTYGNEDVVGYAFENGTQVPIKSTDSILTKDDFPEVGPAEGRHPIPGVTSVTVRHMGANEPIKTTVNWICYNTTQLEFLRQHFLLAGGYVVVEFGNYWSNRLNQPSLFDFSNHTEALDKLTKFVVEGRKFMSDELFEPAQGNYNMVIGRVVDQSMTFQSDGSIHCSTTFYSTGEAVFGLSNYKLLGRLENEEDRKTFNKTINDYFSEGARFDQLIKEPELSPFVVTMKARGEDEVKNTEGADITDAVLEKFNSMRGTFIPWNMFVRNVLGELFGVVALEDLSADAQLFTTINLELEPSVGNHRFLASTDPDTIIIVKSFMTEGSQAEEGEEVSQRIDPQARFGNPFPGSEIEFVAADGSEQKGLLSNGIWINVDAIKETFGQANNFYLGFMSLLRRMNNAVNNYWHLDLAFDEETSKYKIYDRQCVFNSKNIPEAYIFNRNAVGELLDISFDADFSKEAKTAILLSSDASTRKEKGMDEPSVRDSFIQPQFWTEILNIPNLKDELGESVHSARLARRDARAAALKPGRSAGDGDESFAEVGGTSTAANTRITTGVERSDRARTTRLARFADALGAYIISPTELLSSILEDGRRNPNQINNFVSPIPTEINMSLTMVGITGLAFYDTFLVDKLPRIYRDHGVFLINELSHAVDSGGWTTTIGGLYYFVNQRGTGQGSDLATSHTDNIPNMGEGDPEQIESTSNKITRREEKILRDDNIQRQ